MTTKEAVAQRIIDLCAERNIAVNALANISGVSPSTVYSMLNAKSKNPGVVSVKKLCDGLEISVREFFDCPLFDETEQEAVSVCVFVFHAQYLHFKKHFLEIWFH